MNRYITQVIIVHFLDHDRCGVTPLCNLSNTTGTIDAITSRTIVIGDIIQVPTGWVSNFAQSRETYTPKTQGFLRKARPRRVSQDLRRG